MRRTTAPTESVIATTEPSASVSGRSSQYTLDAVGNRRALVVSAAGLTTTTTSTSNAFNQLTASTRNGGGLPSLSTTYAYDSNGSLTAETAGTAATTYTWDADNRLRQVAQPGLLSVYEYDANGLRTKKVESGVETRFLLDGPSVYVPAASETRLPLLS